MNSKKIILSVILTFACLFCFQTMSKAASFSASISKTTVTVGDTFTVTVKANNAAGMYSVTNSNSNVSLSSGSKSEFLENGSASIKFKAVKEGNVTITAKSVDMTDLDNSSKNVTGNKIFNVTIKAKSSTTTSTEKPTFTSANKKVYAKSDINLRSSWSVNSSATRISKGTEMTLTGTSSKAVGGYVWYRVSYKGSTKYVSNTLVTTTKPSKDSDKKDDDKKDENKADSVNLKSLSVTPTGLSPVFAVGTTEYTMTVGSDTNKIDIEAIPEDKNASVKITGNTGLKIGSNKITITVTGANKKTKVYHINVTKEDKKHLQLSELLIEGLPLEPEFDSNVYEYSLRLDKSDISELNITATSSEKNAKVEIVGNTDLKPGENVVTILVKSSNGEETTTYQITAFVPEPTEQKASVEETKDKSNINIYLYVGIGVSVLIVIIILVAIIKRRHNAEIDDIYYGIYGSENNHKDKNDRKNKVDVIDNTQETTNVDLAKLPELDELDLPKSLRKNAIVEEPKFDNTTVKDVSEQEDSRMTDRSKKIDDYNIDDEIKPRRKKGKHSK